MHLNESSRYRSAVVATLMVGTSVAVLWVKWSHLAFSPVGWPQDHGRTIAELFAAGVVFALGSVLLSGAWWRRLLQILAVLCFAGVLVLPIDLNSGLLAPRYNYRRDDRLVTILAKPTFDPKTDFNVVILLPPELIGPPIRLFIGRELGLKLRADHLLEFSIWRTRDVLLPGWRVEGDDPPWSNALETIRDGNETLYDARICPIHHLTMERLELPVHRGFLAYGPAWAEFAAGPGFVQGSCVAPQQTAMGYRCPACAARYEKWAAEREQPARTAK
jgi:hypothetical protein